MLSFNFTPFPILETERLILRQISMEDKEAFFDIRINPVVNRYIDRDVMQSMEEGVAFIQRIIDGITNNESISWVITLKGSTRMLGTIDFWRIEKNHHRAEIGYVLHPDFHGQGIMSEAMTVALNYGFNEMKLHSVEANINPENNASRNILLRHGFVKEAYFRENFHYNGKFLDSEIYSLLTPYK